MNRTLAEKIKKGLVADEHAVELMDEVKRLRNENAWLKRRYRVSSAKMDGKHVWIPGARWPKLVGNTMDEAVKYAMREEEKGYA